MALCRFLGERLAGTEALISPKPQKIGLDGTATLMIGGETFVLRYTDAHYPGDAIVHLPKQSVVFTGDLVYVDRLLGVLPVSSVKNGQHAFSVLTTLKPAHIVPGHGRVCDIARAQRETGDYYDFLTNIVGQAAKEMEPMEEVLAKHANLPAFRHLENYNELHRANMNRAFTEFEAQ
jgi:glyoxylase-like metal-dependent hydrolase (beta-lactamase superfamily II)